MKWPSLYNNNDSIQDYQDNEKWDIYLNSICDYFKVCKDSTVLEIAPFFGTHTNVIKYHSPESITLVEMNEKAVIGLHRKQPDCEIIEDDIFSYLLEEHKFDVVVCCGLLYHLHSPLHLLELIVNRCTPLNVIIESFGTPGSVKVVDEVHNELGSLQISPNWKTAGLKMDLGSDIIIKAMHNMGYKLIEYEDSVKKPGGEPYFCVFEKL